MRRGLLMMAGLVLIAGPVVASIDGSPHDLGSQAAFGTDRICIFCHTPHKAPVTYPLWNHSFSTATYSQYWSSTIDGWTSSAAGEWAGDNGSISGMCMGCHDDTIALGAVSNDYNGTISANGDTMSTHVGDNSAVFAAASGLANHHPVSFTYNASYTGAGSGSADGELDTPANVFDADYTFGGSATTATVECASCHDPHRWETTDPGNNLPFLRESNANSQICTTCHTK